MRKMIKLIWWKILWVIGVTFFLKWDKNYTIVIIKILETMSVNDKNIHIIYNCIEWNTGRMGALVNIKQGWLQRDSIN